LWEDVRTTGDFSRRAMSKASGRAPRPGLGETVMFCPVNRRYTLWKFTEDDALVCVKCGMKVTRAEATGRTR